MTISSSLNAGVAGLSANANKLATIADNIANSSTFGYKRVLADFHSVVVHGATTTSYSAGGVRSSSMRLIDERGSLIGTNNATDLAIDGRGFMAVTSIDALGRSDGNFPISLATTGAFKADADGIMRTASGKVLMGWPANPDGTLGNYPRDNMSGLVPVKLDQNQYVANPTNAMQLGANLPATATDMAGDGTPFEMSVQYTGNLGTDESLVFTFTPTIPTSGSSNTWTMSINDTGSNDAQIAEYTVVFDDTRDQGGTLASIVTVTGDDYDPVEGVIALTVGGGTMALDIGRIGEKGGLTQLSENFAPIGKAMNGTPVARLV